jgi:hypothetical protein
MRPSRRGVLAIGALIVFACYTVHMDERQIRSIAARDMDCDEALVKLETGSSDYKTIARYTARGCERTRDYLCETDGEGRVSCHTPSRGPDDKSSDDHTAAIAAGTAAGCMCANLFASHSSDPSTTSAPSNPNSTTPQRNR